MLLVSAESSKNPLMRNHPPKALREERCSFAPSPPKTAFYGQTRPLTEKPRPPPDSPSNSVQELPYGLFSSEQRKASFFDFSGRNRHRHIHETFLCCHIKSARGRENFSKNTAKSQRPILVHLKLGNSSVSFKIQVA